MRSLTNFLKTLLSQKKRIWSGKVACVSETNNQKLIIYDIFAGIQVLSHEFPHKIYSIAQRGNELLVSLHSCEVYGFDLKTKSTVQIIDNRLGERITCIPLRDGSIAIETDSSLRDTAFSIIVNYGCYTIQLQNGDIATVKSGLFGDSIEVWNEQLKEKLFTYNPKDFPYCREMIELYPGVLCFSGDEKLHIVTIHGTARIEDLENTYHNIIKIRDGMFATCSLNNICVYEHEKLVFKESYSVNNSASFSLVEPGVIAWQDKESVFLFNVDKREQVGKYECKDKVLLILKD